MSAPIHRCYDAPREPIQRVAIPTMLTIEQAAPTIENGAIKSGYQALVLSHAGNEQSVYESAVDKL